MGLFCEFNLNLGLKGLHTVQHLFRSGEQTPCRSSRSLPNECSRKSQECLDDQQILMIKFRRNIIDKHQNVRAVCLVLS